MRILYFTQLFYPALFGGGEYIFYHWARDLAKKGHQVIVITQRLENTVSHEIVHGIEIFRVGSTLKLSGTLPIGIAPNLSFLVSSFFKGIDVIKKNKIDVIHSNTYIPVFAAHLCAKMTRKPHIVTMHDVYYSSKDDFWKSWSGQEKVSKISGALGPMIERLIARLSVTFHTVSEQSKKDMQSSLGIKNTTVIPNGINPADYHAQNNATKTQAIYVGRLVFYKNIDVIIDAFNIIAKKTPDARLVIVGDGPMKNHLINKVNSLGLENNISFAGNISDKDKVKLITESRVLLNPSLVEGFGIVILEGFACGKPVIVSDSKPLSDLVDDSVDGYIMSSHDATAWSEKISELVSNPTKSQEMGEKGKTKTLSKYSISKVTDDLIKLYKQVSKISA